MQSEVRLLKCAARQRLRSCNRHPGKATPDPPRPVVSALHSRQPITERSIVISVTATWTSRAILKGGDEVQGTATAASLWATGAIGIAVGLANYDVALVICLFTVLTLYVLGRLKPKDSDR